MSNHKDFDTSTARLIKMRVGGSPHLAFSDDAGCISMVCRSDRAERGVAVSQAGIEWLKAQNATALFIRVWVCLRVFRRPGVLEPLVLVRTVTVLTPDRGYWIRTHTSLQSSRILLPLILRLHVLNREARSDPMIFRRAVFDQSNCIFDRYSKSSC